MKIDQEEERQYSQILSWIALKIKSFSFISCSLLLYTAVFRALRDDTKNGCVAD